MREKLIELMMDMPHGNSTYEAEEKYFENLADYLIANGVTFATDNDVGGKWIPASERLPEKFGEYTVAVQDETGRRYSDYADYDRFQQRWRTGLFLGVRDKVTHWMPLPEPPEGD